MNLTIPLRGSTAGRQYAGWEPRTVATQGLGNRVFARQRVPVADGVALNADIYTPRTPGRYPAVVSFAAYNSETHTAGLPTGTNEAGSPPVFTDRGYCSVIVERRGMGRSTGESVPFFDPQDVDDHEKVIAWAAEQPWCNGDVVLFGTSYYAITQVFVAARRPPALRAFFAHEPDTDGFRHSMQFGGVPGSFFLGVWLGANFTDEQIDHRVSPVRRALLSHLTNGPLHPLLEKGRAPQREPDIRPLLGERPHSGHGRALRGVDVRREDPRGVDRAGGDPRRARRHRRAVRDGAEPGLLQPAPVRQLRPVRARRHAGRGQWLILGPPVYDLPVYSGNEIDSYVVARLSRVDAAGDAHQLSMGAIRPAGRAVDPTRGSTMSAAVPTCCARTPARATPSSTCRCRPTCLATPCTSAGRAGSRSLRSPSRSESPAARAVRKNVCRGTPSAPLRRTPPASRMARRELRSLT